MIELRWKKVEPTYYDGFTPDPAVRLDDGFAVLQYRVHYFPVRIASGDIVLKPYPEEPDWQDVEISDD